MEPGFYWISLKFSFNDEVQIGHWDGKWWTVCGQEESYKEREIHSVLSDRIIPPTEPIL